ncbi:MAG: efflux RND transporter periplasmic adaptor subunit, partial [Candidatus Levyibacteriota bacterium]
LANLLQAQGALGTAQATMYAMQSSMYTDWNTFYQLATNSTYQNSDGSPNTSSRVLPQFTTAQATWLSAQAAYTNQQTVVNQAQASLSSANLAYSATQNAVVKAPSTGTIANMTAVVGQKVTAQNATAPGTSSSLTTNIPELIVGDFSHNLVQISLNEVDVDAVKVGQKVDLVFDANRNKTYTGSVQRLDAVGNNNSGVITYNTYISIDNADSLVKPGMTVTASIETARHENVLIVPNNAVKPYQGAKAMLVPGAGKDKVNGKTLPFHYVPVTIGIKGITETEITSGVQNGETVVTNTGTLLVTGP